MNNSYLIYFLILAIVCIIYIFSSIKIVPKNKAVVIERFGDFFRILYSGINFINPFFDKPKHIKKMQVTKNITGKKSYKKIDSIFIDLNEVENYFSFNNIFKTNDGSLNIEVLVYYQIIDIPKMIQKIGNSLEAMEQYTKTILVQKIRKQLL